MKAEEFKTIIENQQKGFEEILARLLVKMDRKETQVQSEKEEAKLFFKLSQILCEFNFDIKRGLSFSVYWAKNRSIIEVEVRLLLSKLGSNEYAQIERKLLPKVLSELSLEELVSELSSEFKDPKSKLIKRFEALNLKCSDFEDILEFGNRVNAECERAEMTLSSEHSDSALRALLLKFVDSKNEKGQKVSLKEVLEEVRKYQNNKSESELLAVKNISEAKDPPAKNYSVKKCFECGKSGHLAKNCWSKIRPQVAIIDIVDSENLILKENWLKKIVKISDRQVEFIVDTASQINCISEEIWKECGSPKLEPVSYKGLGIGGTTFEIEGKWITSSVIDDKEVQITIHVIKKGLCILGLPTLLHLKEIVKKFSAKVNEESNFGEKKIFFNKNKLNKVFKKGTRVKVKNTNKRSGKVEWLKGEILHQSGKCWKVKVPELKAIVTRHYSEIVVDSLMNQRRAVTSNFKRMKLSEKKEDRKYESSTSASSITVDSKCQVRKV
ncbi:CCHC-type domain-containing protein [Meloidogyne graminicola]|uniref:CCHC-type domain-containing protein n=1 Tax=Meloidogyne graminicola TaxID=189291 RepID=A0A8S9Z9H4_9BILA|nr:CCHC-type domain-containing protein [Meloidogyne graminicola]